jgi:DNA-binding NtrC family response regulator
MRASPRTVLVVDDEPSLRLLCRVNLELEGHRVLEAATLAEAKSAVVEHDVDVVLLDVHVGPDDGLELVDEIHALDLPTAVVVLSGTAVVDDATRARVQGVLGKPFTLDALLAAVADVSVR